MKTLSYYLIFLLLLLSKVSFSQVTETRELEAFSKIIVRGNSKVTLHVGSPQKVTVEAADAKSAITEVQNGILTITGSKSKTDITVPAISGIEISGSGEVTADSVITAQTLRLNIPGNGKISMTVDAKQIEAGISGYGKMTLAGKAESAEINISGNGKLNANNLQVGKAVANISGVGKVYLDVKDELKLNISGTGSFYYKEKPAVFESNISGIGKYGNYANTEGADSLTIKTGKNEVIIVSDNDDDDSYTSASGNSDSDEPKEPKKSKSHWAGIELGFNTLFTGSDFSTNLPDGYDYLELKSGKSVNVNINIFSHDFKLYKNYIMFTTGIGLTLNNYRFTSDKTLRVDTLTNNITAGFDYDKNGNQINYTKNKLAVNYVTVPLLFQFNTHQEMKKSFHFATGILLSYKYNSHLKLVYDDGGKEKSKRHDEYNIEPFRYDATVRVGYRNYTVFASYALSDFFKSGRGPELHPFQFGINLMGW